MMLRGIKYGPCIDASGTREFFGEGYWFHHLPFIGKRWWNFEGSTFVAKSTTLHATKGNFDGLDEDFRPIELFPKCIWVDLIGAKALNAVGLSGPGADAIFMRGFGWEWPNSEPFMISVVPEGKTSDERIFSFASIVRLLREYEPAWRGLRYTFALQINLSCPNTGTNTLDLINEATRYLDMAAELGIPIIIKINLLVSLEASIEILRHEACDALCLTNTLPFGQLPDRVPWDKWFSNGSPLKEFVGGGGLSGAPLFPLLIEQVKALRLIRRTSGVEKPIIAGGGILHVKHVNQLVSAGLERGLDAISIGSVAMLRPWRIRSIINEAHLRLE